jgi:hypothetical protein
VVSSAALGTAIGLVVLFGVTAMLCSGITESVSNVLQLRAKYLLTGLRAMLDAPESNPGTSKAIKKTLHKETLMPEKTKEAAESINRLIAADPVANAAIAANAFTLALFDHPLIKSLQSRRIGSQQLRNPQYISSKTFARALVDTLLSNAVDPAKQQSASDSVLVRLESAVKRLPQGPLTRSLQTFITQADGNLERFETSLEDWYDDQMARISGWYKRWSRVILGVVGLAVTLLINIDAIQVSHALYIDAPLRQAVATAANAGTLCQSQPSAAEREKCARQELATLKVSGLPFGYPTGCKPISQHPAKCWAWSPDPTLHWWDFPLKMLGWIVTAFAVSFGAPFWFDALSKLGSLRNAGDKPATA